MGRRWVPDRPRPRRKDLREDARWRLQTAPGPVPDAGIRVAVNSGLSIGEVAKLSGKKPWEVEQIMEGTPQGAPVAPTDTQPEPLAAPQPVDAPEPDTDDEYTDEDGGVQGEELLLALFSPDEIAAKAGAARAAGDAYRAGILDRFHQEAVEAQEEREQEAENGES